MKIIIDILEENDERVFQAFQALIDPETPITKERVAEMVGSYINTVVKKHEKREAAKVAGNAVSVVNKVTTT